MNFCRMNGDFACIYRMEDDGDHRWQKVSQLETLRVPAGEPAILVYRFLVAVAKNEE